MGEIRRSPSIVAVLSPAGDNLGSHYFRATCTTLSACPRKSVCTHAMDALASRDDAGPGGGIGRRARFRS